MLSTKTNNKNSLVFANTATIDNSLRNGVISNKSISTICLNINTILEIINAINGI